jgi:ABC-type uncharacterized transport system substrate-binding protein
MKTTIGKVSCLALSTLPLVLCFPVQAQQVKKVPRIGYLQGIGVDSSRQGFRQGLHELGYVEGKNIAIEYLNAEGNEIGCIKWLQNWFA